MIVLLSLVLADPGRTTSGLSVGSDGEAWHLRGHLDHGLTRRLTLVGESSLDPRWVRTAGGLHLELVDTRWWRLGVAGMPELGLERDVALDAPELGGRVGVRGSWLAFWGLSFTGRIDAVGTAEGAWGEVGMGLAVRL